MLPRCCDAIMVVVGRPGAPGSPRGCQQADQATHILATLLLLLPLVVVLPHRQRRGLAQPLLQRRRGATGVCAAPQRRGGEAPPVLVRPCVFPQLWGARICAATWV